MPQRCQSEFLSFYGKDYPLIVKVIQANEALSVQVHPDDTLAKQLEGENERGKTECWYVLDAQKDAKLIYGIKKGVSKEQIESAIKAGNLEEKMNQKRRLCVHSRRHGSRNRRRS